LIKADNEERQEQSRTPEEEQPAVENKSILKEGPTKRESPGTLRLFEILNGQ
jgi:hypothetical protein